MIPLSPGVERIVDAIYSPQRQALAAQLSSLEIKVFFASSALQLALPFGFFYSGAAARLRDALERRVKQPLLVSLAFVAISYAGLAIVLLPLDWWAGFVVSHAYGLSRETPATWFHDWAVGDCLSLMLVALLAVPFGPIVRRFRKHWPLLAAAVAAPLIVFGNAIFPAYVAGLGPTARIAIGDNLLKDLKPDEVLYVVAHEMGHYKLHHIWWGSLYGWLGAIAAIAFLAWAGGVLIGRAAPRLARGLDDVAALPLLAALLLCFALVTAPIANGISRGIEHAADAFAASQTQLGDAGIRAFARLGTEGLSVLHPSPLVVWYFYTHPPLDERLAYAAAESSGSGH